MPGDKPVPYGSTVTIKNSANTQANIVSDEGMVYLSGLQDSGELLVLWGQRQDQRCNATYQLLPTQGSLTTSKAIFR